MSQDHEDTCVDCQRYKQIVAGGCVHSFDFMQMIRGNTCTICSRLHDDLVKYECCHVEEHMNLYIKFMCQQYHYDMDSWEYHLAEVQEVDNGKCRFCAGVVCQGCEEQESLQCYSEARWNPKFNDYCYCPKRHHENIDDVRCVIESQHSQKCLGCRLVQFIKRNGLSSRSQEDWFRMIDDRTKCPEHYSMMIDSEMHCNFKTNSMHKRLWRDGECVACIFEMIHQHYIAIGCMNPLDHCSHFEFGDVPLTGCSICASARTASNTGVAESREHCKGSSQESTEPAGQ